MSGEDGDALDSSLSSPRIERGWFIGTLFCLWCLLDFLAFITAPRVLTPAVSVPPNRYFQPSRTLEAVALVAFRFETYRWILLILAVGAGALAWRGRLDRRIRVLIGVLMAACVALLGCILYAEALPAWVERTYGMQVRERIFAGAEYRLIPVDRPRW
jgi:hypothetical protein